MSPLQLTSKKELSWFDSIAIIIAIVIGVGVFRVPSEVAQYLSSPVFILLAWLIGGIICLLGALCYAELSTSLPKSGGDYIYLRESYGSLAGFLFGWTELLVIRTGSIAAIAFIAAEYLQSFLALNSSFVKLMAIFIVLSLSIINSVGLRHGKRILDILTVTKVVVLIGIIFYGFLSQKGDASLLNFNGVSSFSNNGIFSAFALALIPILWAYGGWHENTFVAGETKNATKILPLTLIGGILTVTVIYLAINYLYLYLIPVSEIAKSSLIGSDLLQILGGRYGQKLLEGVVIISSLGALNATIITGSRITYSLAKDHPVFSFLEGVNAKYGTPHRAIFSNAIWAIALIVIGSFNDLLFFTGVLVWLFFALVVGGLFILRYKYPKLERPYKVWGYPFVPIAFILVCLSLFVNTIVHFPVQSFIGLGIAGSGVPVYLYSQKRKKAQLIKEKDDPENVKIPEPVLEESID